MADPPGHEKEFAPSDPAAALEDINHDEPRDEDGSDREYLERHGELSTRQNSLDARKHEKEYMAISSPDNVDSHSSEGEIDHEKRPEMKQVQSYATSNSAITRAESHVDDTIVKKAWYQNVNPLRWGAPPPVPESRTPSKEHTASFFSLLYFQWMAPIMDVGFHSHRL